MLFIAVGVAGMIGAVLRYFLGIAVHGWWMHSFPLGTLLINYIGSFVLGWFTTWVNRAERVPAWFRVGFGTGLIGSFTTFSTFSIETVTLIHQQLWVDTLLYMTLSLFGGLLMAWSGFQAANLQMYKRIRRFSS
ncbi:fluoride efflux transporter CrcB [Ferviditalea candida]|uniref:Fluoride-specific ion channel FluC n=1 Tax=Ferviditalea candida TaxID=3108399 RepID=A0ABU5ZG03_9BACL|nr:fluoride efflux transporter CrcB [Paenibacillaceae bacterium T2]